MGVLIGDYLIDTKQYWFFITEIIQRRSNMMSDS